MTRYYDYDNDEWIEEIDWVDEQDAKKDSFVENIVSWVIIIGVVGIAFYLLFGMNLIQWVLTEQQGIRTDKTMSEQIKTKCDYSTLEGSVSCLVEDVNTWYYYNISNTQNVRLSEVELKEQGGVCWQYAEWYEDKLQQFGYYAYTTDLDSHNGWSGHRFTIAYNSDNSQYCVIDQISYQCFNLIPIRSSDVPTYTS